MKQGPARVTPPAFNNRTVLSVRKTKYLLYTCVKHRVLRVIMRNIRVSFFAVTFLSLIGEIFKNKQQYTILHGYFFGSDRSPRRGNLVCVCVCVRVGYYAQEGKERA